MVLDFGVRDSLLRFVSIDIDFLDHFPVATTRWT